LQTKLLYEFGKFRLDPANRLLLCDRTSISLTPKAFDLLVVLVQNGTRLITKEELMTKVWPDSFVEETNLTVNISVLRKALGEGPEDRQYIETVPKKGYRFVAPITELREEEGARRQLAEERDRAAKEPGSPQQGVSGACGSKARPGQTAPSAKSGFLSLDHRGSECFTHFHPCGRALSLPTS
jgi:DNA-binding winged helix-turn-helix (wHTH) protein